MEKYNWNKEISNKDVSKNILRNQLKNIFLTKLKGYGFNEVDLPVLGSAEDFIINNENYSTNNLYKTVSVNGEVLSIGDDVIKGLICFASNDMGGKGKICANFNAYSFLPKDKKLPYEYQIGGIVYGESGIEEEADLIASAYEFALSIGSEKPKVEVGNTEAFLGVLNRFSGKEEKLDRVKAILSGRIENDADYATSQTLNDVKNTEGNASIIKNLATKLDNKQSIDGLLNVFEIMNLLEAYNIAENVKVKVGYLGDEQFDNGMVFRVTDDKNGTLVYGGRCDCIMGNEAVRCIYIKVNVRNAFFCLENNSKTPESEGKRVAIAVSPTRAAISKAYKVRSELNGEGIVADLVYNVDDKIVYELYESNKNKMIIYIGENGDIVHS